MSFDPMQFPLAWSDPQYLSDTSFWVQHIPFAWALVEMLRPRSIVELGALKGDSYCAFCQGVVMLGLNARCAAVDTWAGDEHTGFYPAEILDSLRRYHDPKYAAFSTLMQCDFDCAVSRFADQAIDLLHIDGLHTYEAVKHDFETWLPKMSERGVVLFHDTAVRGHGFGVWRLWEELAAKYPSFNFNHEYGLGVLGVGRDLPQAVRDFLDVPEAKRDMIREYFVTLGSRIRLVKMLTMMNKGTGQMRALIDQWRRDTNQPAENVAANDITGVAESIARNIHALIEENRTLRSGLP